MPPRVIEEEETPTVKREPKKAPRRGDDKNLRENLAQVYAMIGGGIASVGMMKNDIALVATGNNVISRSDEVAEHWLELADQNPMVKKFLAGFTEGSTLVGLLGVHVAMLAPLAASRGIVPEPMAMMMLTEDARNATAEFVSKQAQAQAAASTNGSSAN